MPNRILSLPTALSAVAITAADDPDLVDGVHLRVLPAPAIGFPVAPFALYRVTPSVAQPTISWWDQRGELIDGGDVDAAGGTITAALEPPPDGDIDVAVEVLPDDGFEGTVALLDGTGHRVLTSLSTPPYVLAAPVVRQIRVTGHGRISAVRTWRVSGTQVCEQIIGSEPVDLLSLPIDGDRPWYARGLGDNRTLDVVQRAAPKRLTPPDQPDGPFDPVSAADEVLRVQDQARVLLAACEEMLDDPTRRPVDRRITGDLPADEDHQPRRPRQLVDLALSGSLLLRGLDPGAGRYLGLVGHLDEHPAWTEPAAYAVAGLFALDPARPSSDQLGPSGSLGELVTAGLAARLGADGLVADIGARGLGVQVRALAAVTATVRPSDPPVAPAAQPGPAHWLDGGRGASTTFQQALTVAGAPLGALVALARHDGGTWLSRHRPVDLPAPAAPARRAVPMLLGRTAARPPLTSDGLLSDSPVPADQGGTHYRLALADLFGRFGPGVDTLVGDPDRPVPPRPVVLVRVEPAEPPGTDAASPGVLQIEVAVPSIVDLAAGAVPVAAVELVLDGRPQPPAAVPVPGEATTIRTTLELPELTPGGAGRVVLNARFTDVLGRGSETTEVSATFADQRRPAVVATGPGLIWTSRPGPAPEVELTLCWPGRDLRYRVYVADGPGLGLTATERARMAVDGYARDRAGELGGRDRFRLLTEPPLQQAADGIVTFTEPLPRSLASVQFLRIVPLTAANREAAFDSCGVVAVAVPTDRRPPAPAVHVVPDPATGSAVVTVEAVGLDLDSLAAAEPGLFAEPPDPSARAPQVRLRRAAGPVADPVYAREVGRGTLSVHRDGEGGVTLLAELTDPGPLVPFVRYSYWAEVRLSAERRLAPEVADEVLPPGGIRPLSDEQVTDMVRPFSAASAPATVLFVPDGPQPELTDPVVTVAVAAGQATVTLNATDTPATHLLAIGRHRLRIWPQWGDGPAETATEVTLSGGPLVWSAPARADDGSTAVLSLIVFDPLGRSGPLLRLPSA